MEGNIKTSGWDHAGHGLEFPPESEAWMPGLAAYIRDQAGIDPLTGLDARPRFEARVVQELKRAARSKHCTAVAVIEIHGASSDPVDVGCLIVAAAAIIRRELRDLDSIARIGDAQFAALLPMCDAPSANLALARAVVSLCDIPGARVSAGVASTAETVEIAGWDIIEAACACLAGAPPDVGLEWPVRAAV